MSDAAEADSGLKRAMLVFGPLIVILMLVLPTPEGLTREGWAVAAVALLMGLWWMTEAIPLAATALLPLVLFPALGIAPLDVTAVSYANPLIFLFLGGFLMARAMEKQHLSQRVAYGLLQKGSLSLPGIIASMMVATAFLSMWVSNTATTMMMLPIGQSIILAVNQRATEAERPETAKFATALMLAIAYSATIGGMGTLIGTPPNALFAGFMSSTYGIEIEFWRWMMIGVPAVIILLPIAWVLLTKVSFRFSVSRDLLKGGFIEKEARQLGPFSRAEFFVAVILGGAAFFWVFRGVISDLFPSLLLSDAGIAIAAALLLFILPASRPNRARLLSWDDAKGIRWDVLLLFGGGLALAGAINDTGLASWIGGAISLLAFLPLFLFLLGMFVVIVLLGELASNTAVAAIFLPVAGASAVGLGMDPSLLVMSVALAATIGFMLPVATPPNAIVFGSGMLKVSDMLKAGAILDVIAILVVVVLAMTLGPMLFGNL
ncbi:MAG: anion transporter [Rhodobacteraceae bacterium]|nr:MAG: anion transporter [Paracoccaceae bacterium]